MNHFVQRYSRTKGSSNLATSSPEHSDRETLASEHATLVRQIAGRIASRLPGHYELEDLWSAGIIGLLTAIDNFDESKGIPFDRYARIRIEGAVLDSLRQTDHLPRTRRQKAKKLEETRRTVERELGRPALDEEVAEAAGETVQSIQSTMIDSLAPTFLAPSDLAQISPATERTEENPFDCLASQQVREALSAAVQQLPERLQLVMSLYYKEEFSYKQIGTVLGISESRTCHLHADAVKKLRKIMRTDE
jgi:RNA polymerase sigma factor for flagellar operon FliA